LILEKTTAEEAAEELSALVTSEDGDEAKQNVQTQRFPVFDICED